MTTKTESHSFGGEARTTSHPPRLPDRIEQKPSSDEPTGLASEHQEQHDANHESVPSTIVPLSKARYIALVATVTGATFLNVSLFQLTRE